jgi:hypothetical protein
MASTEMEVDMPDGKKSPEISPARKGPIQSLMVTPRISWHIPINEAHLAYINSNLDAFKHLSMQQGEWGNICVYDSEPQESRQISKH